MLFLYQKYIKKELKEKVACTGCKLKLQLQKAVVTTIDKLGVKEENGVQLTFFSCLGLRLCGWPKHVDSEETATVLRSLSEPVDRIVPFGISGEVVD
jgi:hypothetical protein